MKYNQVIKDMMRRDEHFRSKMEKLGYKEEPIVAILDYQRGALFTEQHVYPLDDLHPDYLNLFNDVVRDNNKALGKLPMTEKLVKLAEALSEEAPVIEANDEDMELMLKQNRQLLHNIFTYEMLLLSELEQHLGDQLTDDEVLGLVHSQGLNQGFNHVSDEIVHSIALDDIIAANAEEKRFVDGTLYDRRKA